MQKTNFIEPQDILNATNGGLDIIFSLYPQAVGCDVDKKKKFKLRGDEKTASANLKQADDGNWLVTDFGGDRKSRNGILCYAEEQNIEYVDAIRELAAIHGIAARDGEEVVIKAEYSSRPAATEDKESTWTTQVRSEWTDFEIEAIISKNVLKHVGWKSPEEHKAKAAKPRIVEAFDDYNWHPLVSYSYTKDRKVHTYSATDQYPIYLIDEGDHKKLYQPYHPDKGRRFLYIGNKPKNFVHGLKQLKEIYEENKSRELQALADKQQEDDRAGNNNNSAADDEQTVDKKARVKQVVLCSGGSDAINVSLLGFYVVWLNSETEGLPGYLFHEINKCVEKFYQLTDIDNTGKAAAHALAMEYLDICTIELPEDLKKYRDRRGNPCKDVRDYLNHYKAKDFRRQMEVALPYRFWEKKKQYEGRGENKTFIGYRYDFKNTQANNFLMKNGFGKLRIGDTNEWIFIKRTGNLVKEVDADAIQDFIHDFLEERNMDIDLRDAMITTSKLNASTLTRLKFVEIQFKDHTPQSQYYFFDNKTVEISKDKIECHKPGVIDRYIWDRDFLRHKITPIEEPPFTITKDDLGNFDIEIHNHDCMFLKFLIQVSRIHWRDELETGEKYKAMTPAQQEEYKKEYHCTVSGPNLSAEQIEEQKLHLINKIFSIGFLMHHYHDPTKGWFVYAVDGKISEDGRSHGGSGKSIMMNRALRTLLPSTFFLNGRLRDAIEDKFKYDSLMPYHRYYYIDDCHEYLNLDSFYVDITEDLVALRKGKSSVTIPFAESGKFAFSSNYMPRDVGPSTERRIIYTVFSDYYHNHGENDDYLEFRSPKTDLGITMFVDFDQKQYNQFFHTMFHSLKFFLGVDNKIGPVMENVNKRTLLAEMGDNFHAWAIAYFSPESGNVDKYVVREYAFEEYKHATKDRTMTSNSWFKRLASFCKYYGFVFNPKEYLNPQKKIIKKADVKHLDPLSKQWVPTPGADKVTKEMIFIKTRDRLPEDPHTGFPAGDSRPDDDKPKESQVNF